MKKSIAGGLVALLVAGGVALTGGAASAHTPQVSATCEAIQIDATSYDGTRPAQGEPTLTIANPDYVAPTPGSPAVGTPTITVPNPDYVPAKPATYEDRVTEREYKKWHLWYWDYKWFPENANPQGWTATGNVKTEKVETAPAQPAQGTPTIEVANPDYKPEVPATPAQGEPTITVPNPDYVAADTAPNTVTATVDGEQVLSASFGSQYSTSIPLEKYEAHEYSVTITAWNDPTGSKGWTKTYTGATTACDYPAVGPRHNANGEATCGAYSITLYNQQGEHETAQTASFVTYIDGEFADAYAVAGGEQQTITGTFPEDSGNHQVIVRTGPAQGDEFVFSLDVASDCIPVQPEPTVTYGEWTTGEYACGDTTVQMTREVTTTEQVWNGTEYVDGESITTTQTETRDLTAEEIAALECETVTPPTEEPTTPGAEEPTAPVKPAAAPAAKTAKVTATEQADTLATTGGESALGVAALAMGLIAAGVATMAARRRHRA